MAKRKRKKVKKEKIQISIELYAIALIIITILGLGKLGPAGRLFASFSLFLTGSIYMVNLLKDIYLSVIKNWKYILIIKK